MWQNYDNVYAVGAGMGLEVVNYGPDEGLMD